MICRKRWALEPQTGAQNRTHATNELAEDSRFARELIAQELGILALINRGVRVLTANGDDLTDSSDPSRAHDAPDSWSLSPVRKGAAGRQAKGRPRPGAC
jgi:hypothetical protein